MPIQPFRALQQLAVACYGSTLRYLLILTALSSCSQYSNAPMSKSWHNLNAKYNAYLMAAEDLKGAKKAIFENRQENYAQTLPIFLPIDSTQNIEIKPLLDDAIQKASLVAERHQNSKWLDNAYLVIGESRLLKQDYINATEVFKFINTKGKKIEQKHKALILLMRTYTEENDNEAALRVAELLRLQDLNDENTKNFYLTKAYYHQKNQEFDVCVAILEEALKVMKKTEESARIHYIAGQLYEQLKQPKKSYEHYQEADNNRASYDLAFYSQMNALLNQAGSNKNSLGVVQNYFKEMLDDRKNIDLQDKIYLTMGRLEVQQQNFKKGLELFRKSAKKAPVGTPQAAFAYLETAELYYNKFQDYTNAQAYYDSALSVLPPNHASYVSTKKRQKVLTDFVKYYNIAKTEDSLQQVVKLSPAEIDNLLNKTILAQDEEEKKLMEMARKIASQGNQRGVYLGDAKNRWALYDPIAIQSGKGSFKQTWGNRILEDNWRRSNKNNDGGQQATDSTVAQNPNTINKMATASFKKSIEDRKKELLANLPNTPESLEASKKRQEIAYYQVGKIYQLQLNEPKNAKTYFELLINKFPKTIYEPEALYLLALNTPEPYKQQLISKYPLTSFARLIQKENQGNQTGNDAEAQAQYLYASVYKLYEDEKYDIALKRIEEVIAEYSGVKIEDKMSMLRILLLSKTKQKDTYVQALNDFTQSYPASILLPRIKNMMEVLK